MKGYKKIDEDFLISYGRIGERLIEILKEDDVSESNVRRVMNLLHEFHIFIKESKKTNLQNPFIRMTYDRTYDRMKNTVNESTLPLKVKSHFLNLLNAIKKQNILR